jgi:O-antigen/teichoic acid export membrane protein
MFIVDLFSAFGIFGLELTVTRFYYSKEGRSFILSNGLVILISATAAALISLSLLAGSVQFLLPSISNFLYAHLFLFLAIIVFNTITNFSLAHYAALKKAASYAKIQFVKIILFCLFSFLFVYFNFGIIGVFFALLISSVITALIFIFNVRKMISLKFSSYLMIKNMVSYGFPLALYSVVGTIVVYSSRILLERYTDLKTLGVYSFFLMLTLQVNGLWSSVNRAWTPEVFSQFLQDKKKALENVKFMVFFSSFAYLAAIIFFVVIGKFFLFNIIFKEIYLSNIYIFYILLLGPLFMGIYTAVYPLFYYQNKTKKIFLISLFINFVNVGLTFIMIKFFRQNGAAISYFLVSILTALVYLFGFKKTMQIPRKIINWTLMLSILTIVDVAVLLETSSSFLFLTLIIFEALLAFKTGNLAEKKHILFDFLKDIRILKFKKPTI